MSWFLRGVQSAVFHYASCAPCTGYAESRKRRREAKQARKVKEKLQLEHPDEYQHPEPTGTNPYWCEEIQMGPGPPREEHSSVLSKGGSSLDGDRTDNLRLSDDTVADDNWNRKRYQREDEDLWGIDDPPIPIHHTTSGSSVGVTGFNFERPETARSVSYYSVRAPPVNDLHPPVVSLPSPDPADNRWMLQPPPKASIMAGRERAKTRSRSGSGASSRIELSLQRQLSTKQVLHKLERGQTPEVPSISRNSSYSNLVSSQRQDKSRTAQPRQPSTSSSYRRKRRDTAISRSDTTSTQHSSGEDTLLKSKSATNTLIVPDNKAVRVRQSRPALSTVVSSGSEAQDHQNEGVYLTKQDHHHDFTSTSTQSTDSISYLTNSRTPLSTSDISSLNCLQELVRPHDLLQSRFVSAPLVEAKIQLPPSDNDEAKTLSQKQSWVDSGLGISQTWDADHFNQPVRVPFDNLGAPDRDPRLRWSVDF
ncbi:hypothetical protein GQ44DRAFT_724211 [Phaeosphaeriaceae sp. PMI808]|nr:hypothetical protein GQ44DRAFT_724211 [Phaeosphaeriaceae sp. PMI808]